MTTLLQLNASLFADQGQSSQLADRFVQAWRTQRPDSTLIRRDLASNPVPHLNGARFAAFTTAAEQRTPEQQAAVAESDALIDELRRADVIVLGLPMYNFGLPSQLKAYFDHIARAGETFRYTATGPQGLLTGKKVYVFATRGGDYLGTPADTQTAYVRDFLRFIGIADVHFVYAEGLAISPERKAKALAEANDTIARLAA